MDKIYDIRKAAQGLGRNQKLYLKSLYSSPQDISNLGSAKHIAEKLIDKGLVDINDRNLYLTELGQAICAYWEMPIDKKLEVLSEADDNKKRLSLSAHKEQERLKKSNHFLELYKKGLSYQKIGDKFGISRERVRQILTKNVKFHEYIKEKDEAKIELEKKLDKEKKELDREKIFSRSLAYLYPEKVSELWDHAKNGTLKPEEVVSGSAKQYIWFKCPIDGHSWKKKANDITTSWTRYGTSGCPKCAGKLRKAKAQPLLAKIYPKFVGQYWNYTKNAEAGLNPEKLSLGSNKKAWFKCPVDGYEWHASIASTVTQQWSKDNAGCRACNGTSERKRGKWKRREALAADFPEELTKYWLYEANNELELDPTKLTIGSSKEAFFKCPIDGYEWVAKINAIAKHSWAKGNSGCPACRGLVVTEKTSLIGIYPTYVGKYWDYKKNNKLGLYPDQVTRGSTQIAWFRCSHDNFEWKTKIGSLTRSSWDFNNNGCPRCGSGWTLEAIRQFVASLEEYIPNLTQAELYKIFEQSGVLDSRNSEGLKIVKSIIKGKLTGQKLRSFTKAQSSETEEALAGIDDELPTDTELQVVDGETIPSDGATKFSSDTQDYLEENPSHELPKIKAQKSLEFLSSDIVASADQEAIDFFIASRRNRIWAEVFEDVSAVEGIEKFSDEGYGRQVRDDFLDEYNQARDIKVPAGWAFRVNGKVTPPNLMQKVAAVRLRSQKRMLNFSLTGTGKTISGILSSRIIDARLTIIICPLDTIPNWHGEIKHVFPDSLVTIKNFNPHWQDLESRHHYIILNHEMFQQPSISDNIRRLLNRFQVDFVIVDEIHRCKQRGGNPSKRRQMTLALITNAAEQNPNLHVLGMSATPVINNLKEGKSLVELVTGLERSDLGERATINNCMRLHQTFVTLGIRSKKLFEKLFYPLYLSSRGVLR